MARNYLPTNTSGVPNSHFNENVTSPATLPVTLPPAGNGPQPGPDQQPPLTHSPAPAPAPPYTEHSLEVVGCSSITTTAPYSNPILGLTIGNAKTPTCACNSPLPALCYCPNPDKQDSGSSLCVRASEEPSSLRVLCDPCSDNDAIGLGTTSPTQALMLSRCATISTLGSKDLNYHVNPNNDVYRWQTTNTPIPVGIDISSFETDEQGLMAQRCLRTVLGRFNANNVGPQFQFVHDPCHSAFFIRFGGDYPMYAHAFFPGSPPKDWYIDVFKPGLTLSAEQAQFLMQTRGRDICAARSQALEQNLISILTHEMLHVVGVRHCDAHLTEKDRCVRFPADLSDQENDEDRLMQRMLNWRALSQLDWMNRTIQDIQQIYAMNVGEYIGCFRIHDVSWQDGAKQRKEIALRNARCCGV